MKKTAIEAGTRIKSNLELITHLDSEMCEIADKMDFEFLKEKIHFNAYIRAEKFIQNIQDCRDGNDSIST